MTSKIFFFSSIGNWGCQQYCNVAIGYVKSSLLDDSAKYLQLMINIGVGKVMTIQIEFAIIK